MFQKVLLCSSFLLIPVLCISRRTPLKNLEKLSKQNGTNDYYQCFIDALTMDDNSDDPYPVTGCDSLTEFCVVNEPANYPNPYNCNQYLDCGSDQPFIWTCPWDLYYDPFADICGYPDASDCPDTWADTWNGDISCQYVGQRPWSPMMLPLVASPDCGTQFVVCQNNTQIGDVQSCPDGFAYSKAMEGCLRSYFCNYIDPSFNLYKK